MNSNRKTAIIVGVLFIISTVAGILSAVFLEPILNAPDYLINVSANENQVIIGALLELICAGAFLCITVMMFPILKKYNENIALGYVVARILEAVPFVVGVISLLSLLTLSQEYVQAGAPDAPHYLPLGTLLLEVHDLTNLLGSIIIFSLTALILNYSSDSLYPAALLRLGVPSQRLTFISLSGIGQVAGICVSYQVPIPRCRKPSLRSGLRKSATFRRA